MKFTYITLINYAGIYQGCSLKRLDIDFTKCKNRICVIKADNGSGKSTLLAALNILPDSNDMFIPKEEGRKEIGIIDNDIQYKIICEHPVNKDGSRKQTRAYIKKLGPNGYSELNSTGTIGSFKDVIYTEFGLDPNYMALSTLSTEDKGLVEKTPTERKKYVNAIINNVEVFNNIQKTLSKRNSINKGLMNNLLSKIDNIGDVEITKNTLESISNRIIILEAKKDEITNKIAENNSMIKVLDPDLSIQNSDSAIRTEIKIIGTKLEKELQSLQYIFSNNKHSFSVENCGDLEKCTALHYEYKNTINNLISKVEELKSNINDSLLKREEESQALILKTQRLQSLQSENNYMDIEAGIKQYSDAIDRYEKMFDKANIKNAINITKDEYILGLNTLKDIKEMIDGFKSYSYNDIIIKSVDFIINNQNPYNLVDYNEKELANLQRKLNDLTNKHAYNIGLLDKVKLLSNRPSNCTIDSCPFVKDLISASKANPEEEIKILEEEIYKINEAINITKDNITTYTDCLTTVKDIKIILRNIDNNKSIIKKLPNNEIFLNTELFLNKLKEGHSFDEINEVYQFINYANAFEEYKIAKDTLYKLNIEYKIYESKNEIIKEIESDIDSIQSNLNKTIEAINASSSIVQKYEKQIADSADYFDTLDTIISTISNIKSLKKDKEEADSKMNAISINMTKIKGYLVEKENLAYALNNINNELTPLLKDRDTLKYNLRMLEQYHTELDQIVSSYNTIEVLKKYSTPSQKGIQNIFIRVYMNQSLSLANKILSMFFNGKLILTNFIIGEEGFSIPCISMNTGMEVDDVKSCSRSEKAMASLALSAAMFKQSSTKYNIFRLDEIDEGLDAGNRLIFIDALNTILNILEVEQCILVSHSSELSLGNVDIIKLKVQDDTIIANEGNIIYQL